MRKKFAILLCFLALSSTLFAQDINKNDAAGKRHGQWKGTYDATKKPRYEGTFDHGKETGTFKFFADDAKSTLMATRVFDADGSCYTTFLDPEGNKVSEGREVNRLQEGEWKYYHHKSKAIMSTERYIKGKLTGLRKVFFKNGAIAEEITYVNGVKEGIYKKYNEKGKVLEDALFSKDNYNGQATYRDVGGNIVSQGIYTDGLKTGVWKFYKNGAVVKQVDMSAERKLPSKKSTN
jgi:antitoxin component YwqK of YwqJK toxin-antitoxin module